MPITFVQLKLINPANEKKQTRLRVMVDSGAVYSVVTRKILQRLGIRPHSN